MHQIVCYQQFSSCPSFLLELKQNSLELMSRIVSFLTQGLSATGNKLKPKFFPLVSAGDVGLPGPAGNDRYLLSLMIHTLVYGL